MQAIPLNNHLCFKLYVASRYVMRGYAAELAPLELTYPKYLVLLALSESDEQSVGSLVETLRLDFGTVSPLLKSLEKSGYLKKVRQSGDERSVASHITPSGRAVLKKAMAVAYGLFCETEMAQPDLVVLRESLDDYIGRCQKILDRQKSKTKALKGAKNKGSKA